MKARLVSCFPSRRRANCSGEPDVSSTPQYITLTDDGQVLAEATICSATYRPSIHADLHVGSGHLPVGTRTRLVDVVLDLSAAEPGNSPPSDPPLRRPPKSSTGFGNAARTCRPDPPEL